MKEERNRINNKKKNRKTQCKKRGKEKGLCKEG